MNLEGGGRALIWGTVWGYACRD